MDAANQEAALKKKLHNFTQELQVIGTVAGFRHFTCCMRGREELVINVNNTLNGSGLQASAPSSRRGSIVCGDSFKGIGFPASGPSSRRQSLCDSLNSARLPYDKGSLILSHNTQVGLSGLREKGVGLPPASPAEEEDTQDEDETLFLIAGYARYSCPYVWVRSNHERLLKLSGAKDSDKDSPLRLRSTHRWKDSDVHIIDIIAEVVRLCTYPAPRNPFEVDLEYFHSLNQPDQFLASAAMMAYLQKIVIVSSASKSYSAKVFEDLQRVSKLHFTNLRDLAQKSNIPILQQQQQQHQQQRQNQKQSRHSGSRSAQYPKVQAPATAGSPIMQPAMSVYPTTPVNPTGAVYGQGASGAFPGGFNRTPAPSLF